ncbi:MAG: GNAT family N-acetyltransferase [Bacteroidetes bacterium]|nr:GNAT family N-acetyltransferase [Bacteroidota bacterium]
MEIRNYRPGDENKILGLFEQTFKKKISINFWKWRYIENCEKKTWVKLMWDGKNLVGNYSLFPVQLMWYGKPVLTGLSMTTMTHPEYSGKGIFTTLANSLYDECREKDGVKFIWGFPNKNSHNGFINKLQWVDIVNIPMLSLNTSMAHFIPNSTGITRFTAFETKHEHSYHKNIKRFVVGVNKTKEYLNWRYLENPMNNYDFFEFSSNGNCYFCITKLINSFSVTGKKEIDIVDFCLPEQHDSVMNILSHIYHYYSDRGDVVRMNTWIPDHTEENIIFKSLGFTEDIPYTILGSRIFDPDYAAVTDSKSWFFTMGDSDVF